MSDIESGNQNHNGNVNPIPGAQNSHDENRRKMKLYKAALSNNWKEAEKIYNAGMKYGVRITSRGETALHVAALAGHIEFVQNLVQKMNVEEIRTETKSVGSGKGNTAFHCAVISGNVRIAKAIMKCEDLHDLAMARGEGIYLPIYMAAEKGNEEMVRFLYDFTYEKYLEALICRDDDDEDQETLFLNLIKSNIFDVALRMAKTLFCQTIAPDELEEAALEELAQIPLNPPGFLDRCINSFSCRQAVVMHENAVELVELLWASLTLNEKRVSAFIKFRHPNPIIEAAKSGNFHFLSILISTYPDLLFICDRNKHTIIHHAILNRHVDIFKFLHIGSVKTVLTSYRDHEGNNMLHLSAKLAPPDRLNVVPGAALQLQRELLWFEEAKKVMKPHEVNRRKYYLSEFPLETMLSLVQKMKVEMDEVVNDGGLFEKLKEVLDRQSSESRKYHPNYQGLPENELSHYSLINDHKSIEDMANSMNQRDIVLLFKKLKTLMEQEYDQLEHFTEFWKMLDSFQEMVKEINEHDSEGTGYRLVLNKTKGIVGWYYPLRYYLSQHQLLILLKEFNELMNGYESNQSTDTDLLFEELRTLLVKCPSSAQPTDSQFDRVNDFFLDIARLTNQYISDTEKKSDTATFFKELKKLTENYTELKDNPPRTTQMFEEMLQIFGEIDEVMKQLTVPLDDSTESILELLNSQVRWSNLPTHVKYKKVMDLFQEMKKVMEKHERNQK